MALETVSKELATAKLLKKCDIHSAMIRGWMGRATGNIARAFGARAASEPPISAAAIESAPAGATGSSATGECTPEMASW
ncbi:hypothetical protein [Poseidonocella sp. HB161398]|uniref:hypothetical protein n=1 Tax=Poseidonocella sp. HB161398 TaxID=2320855 RepID=UPI001109DC1C|nr:hypothetical protein [Poseidonocella sp. HB161398]